MLNVQVTWEPTFHYKTHIATAALDFSLDNNQRVSFNNVLYDGSVIPRANWVTVDNTSNPSPVQFKDGSLTIDVLPFERATHKLLSSAGYLDFFGTGGTCVTTFSEVEYVKASSFDNQHGNVYPTVESVNTYAIASGGVTNFPGIALYPGESAIFIADVTGNAATYDLNTGYPQCFENGVFNLISQFVYDGVLRSMIIGWVKCISALAGAPTMAASPQIVSTAGAWRLHTLKLADARKSPGTIIDSSKSLLTTTTVAAQRILIPSQNLSGLKRLGIMVCANNLACTHSNSKFGAYDFDERFDANQTLIAVGNIEKAGSTGNGEYTISSAAGSINQNVTFFIRGDK